MAQDFSRWLDEFKARINIVDVVGRYVTLNQKGGKYWACCPFHHEKTPSFAVDDVKNMYYCFGCHVGGDAIHFVEEIEHVDFMDAIKILAEMYHETVPEFTQTGNVNSKAKKEYKDRLYGLMKATALYYNQNLKTKEGAPGKHYWMSRGVSENTITVFGLGYSLGYNQLVEFLTNKGYSVREMVDAGVVGVNNQGRPYDVMAERVIVPIVNNARQVIAFGGRIIKPKENVGKYLNTKETILFNKSNELFGQHSIKRLKLEEEVKSVIMVEGYMDVISLYQAGIKNAMASMGTALTNLQSRLVKRYANEVIICYDGDSAGQNATIRGLDILQGEGLEVKVMSLPDGKDPDEFVKQYGKEGYLKLMMSAKPLISFKLENLAKSFDLKTAEGIGRYAVEAMKMLNGLRNPALIDAYIPKVSEITGLSRTVLYEQSAKGEMPANAALPNKIKKKGTATDKAIRFVLYALFGGIDGVTLETDISQFLVNPEHIKLYDIYRANNGKGLTLDDLMALDKEYTEVSEILIEGDKISDENAENYFNDCVDKIINTSLTQKLKELSEAYDKADSDELREMYGNQLIQLQQLKTKKRR